MSVSMTAKKGFTNPRITGPRPNGAVSPGESFTTDWLHGKELRQSGLAEPDDEKAFDDEPVEMIQPHNQISEPELRRVNARRAARTGGQAAAASAPGAVTGEQLQRAPHPPLDPAAGASGDAAGAPTASVTATSVTSTGPKSNAPAIPPAPGATVDPTKP